MIPFLVGSIVRTIVADPLAGSLILGSAAKVAKDVIDDKIEDAREEGFIKASKEYEEKFGQQVREFENRIKNLENDLREYDNLVEDMEEYIAYLENKIKRLQKNGSYEQADKEQITLKYTRQGLKKLQALRESA